MVEQNKSPDFLIFKDEQYKDALYALVKVMGTVIVAGKALKEAESSEGLLVEYSKEKDAYRFTAKKKRKRGIVTPRKGLILPN